MDETQNQEPVSMTPKRVSESEGSAEPKKSRLPLVAAIVVIVVILGAIFYMLEKQGTIETGVFGSSDAIAPNAVIATVNDVEILGSDLNTGINQIAATAQLQGIDVTDPNVQAEIQGQAVEMLVNTALLEQEAADRGISIDDTAVEERIALLIQEIGSEELLNERMSSLGIDEDALVEDVRSELEIQALLDAVFAEQSVSVTEEEVTALYESTIGDAEDAPTLEELRPQLEAQLQAVAEQQAVDALIASLRTDAEVTITQ